MDRKIFVISVLLLLALAVTTAQEGWHFQLRGADSTLTINTPHIVEIYFVPDSAAIPGNNLGSYSSDIVYDPDKLFLILHLEYAHGDVWEYDPGRIDISELGIIRDMNGNEPSGFEGEFWPDETTGRLAPLCSSLWSLMTIPTTIWAISSDGRSRPWTNPNMPM